MRFAKLVAALAIIFAATSLSGHNVYAEDTNPVEEASDASITQATPPQQQSTSTIEITVTSGDSLTGIAQANNVTVDAIATENSIADPNIIEPGQTLTITKPNSSQEPTDYYGSLKAAAAAFITPPVQQPTVAVAQASTTTSASKTTVSASSAASSYRASSAGNTYVWGTCTWYVKERKPNIPNHLGNGGYGWIATAAAAGYATGTSPVAGAIGVESGHVAIVEGVNANGTVNISEMNYAGGVGVVHYRTVPASEFQYIYA